ncbi:TPA: GTPase Era [Candidatus Poribacteria bacterium]|nr:GTPase Era [Candidatus Poribacteria bacterium]
MKQTEKFRSGYVTIIGEPNVGKSTLLNAILGEKLAIVTPKPQTTRNRITGILTTDNYQIIFLDTPGILRPKYRLQEHLIKAAFAAADDADVILYMIDVKNLPPPEFGILERIKKSGGTLILVINKIDLIPKTTLLPLISSYSQKFDFQEIIPISATQGDGVSDLLDLIVKYIPYGPAYYPEDQLSDLPERFFVAETIREKVFLKTKQEIPYASCVLVDEFKERERGKIYIHATIYVERNSQKGIIIGKGGRTLKEIGQLAREEIETLLQAPVFLNIRVKVKENWRKNERDLKELGYGI